MRKKYIKVLLISLLSISNLFSAEPEEVLNCYELNYMGIFAKIHDDHQLADTIEKDGNYYCKQYTYKIANCLVESRVVNLKKVGSATPEPICVDLFRDRNVKSKSAYYSMLFNDDQIKDYIITTETSTDNTNNKTEIFEKTIDEDTGLTKEIKVEVKGNEALSPTSTTDKIKEIQKEISEISDEISKKVEEVADPDKKEEIKRSYFDKLLNNKIYNPKNYYSLEKLKNPMNVSFEPKTYQVNTIFEECKEAKQKIPTFNLSEILNVIKKTIFDLEGEIEKSVTGYVDNIKNTILDITSDEAVLSYSIMGFANVIAGAVCKFRQLTIDTIKKEGTEKFCKQYHDTSDNATTCGTKKATTWAGLFGSITAGTTMIGSVKGECKNTNATSNDNDQTACEQKAKALMEDSYEKCMNEEPEKIKNYIIGLLKQQISVGKVEIETLNTCSDKEMRDNFINKNVYDNAGKPYKNKITSFLNKQVDFLQNDVRDLALGVMQKSLKQVSLEARTSQLKTTSEDLVQEARKTTMQLNLSQKFPDLSTDRITDYREKGEYFLDNMSNKGYGNTITNALKLLTFMPSNSGVDSYLEYVGSEGADKGLMGQLMGSLNLYDFKMNYWFGADLSIATKPKVSDTETLKVNTEEAQGNYPDIGNLGNVTDITRVMKLFKNPTDSNAKLFVNKQGTAKKLKQLQADSINEFYKIWKAVLQYMENDFTFEHRIFNVYDSSSNSTTVKELTYSMPVEEIKNVILKEFTQIFNSKYRKLTDKNGKKLKGFDVDYIKSQLKEIEQEVLKIRKSEKEEDIAALNNYMLDYYRLVLDYNLFTQTLFLSNSNSIMSVVEETNMRLGSLFSELKGYQVDTITVEFEKFLIMLNK